MRPTHLILASAVGSLSLLCGLGAQTPGPAGIPLEVLEKLRASGAVIEEGGVEPQEPGAAAAPSPDQKAADARTQKLLQAWKQVQWDRRPSSILAAWAAPELEPYDPAKDEDLKKMDAEKAAAAAAAGAVVPPKADEPAGDAAASLQTVPGGAMSRAQLQALLQSQYPSSGPVATPVQVTPLQAVPVQGTVVPATPAATTPVVAATPVAAPPAAQASAPGAPPAAAEPPAAPTEGAVAGAAAKPAEPPVDEARKQLIEQKTMQREMEMLQRDVTLGRWHKVGEFLQALPEKERKKAYEHFLTALPRHPQTPETQRVPPNLQEKNRFAFEDALALAALAPGGFDKEQCKQLAPILQRSLEDGSVPEELVRVLQNEVNRAAAQQRLDRREAAILLATLGQEVELGVFLPTASAAEKDNDREALNLLARHALAMHAKEQKRSWLEQAWLVTQAALAKGEVKEADKQEALRRAVELAPKVREELGPSWLAESFTKRPERGMEIIATIGGQVAKGFQDHARDAAYRASGLALQKTAVDSLLEVAPQLAQEWRDTLGLLASGWIVEASYCYTNSQTTSWGPVMERDDFGNIFWTNRRMGGGGAVAAIEPADVLKSQPGPAWAALMPEALQPHFTALAAQLWLKVNEHDKALPFIEQLSAVNPRKAKDLAHEFLRVWMRNNNPNVNSRTNSYMFIYGFDERASGIPLTRSKQERNLAELASYVERLRQLPIGGIDEGLLGEAFVAAHSKAEVYRLETIEKVFGDVRELEPRLLGKLLSTMRTNLATVWQVPAVQEEAKTKRSQKEMLAEVARGYEVALKIAQDALLARGRHWSLLMAVGAILHDQNNFAQQQQRNSGFSEARKAAFELFAEGADHYATVVDDYRRDEETTDPFSIWFYAALGASDLRAIDEETVLARSQLARIRAAIDALPDDTRERHLGMFANELFTRMSAVKPQIKYRYLDAGFEIVGDHEQAAEAKKVWDYYQDLIRELRLEAVVEGATEVGTAPFGVRIDIVHSPEIERESGGFQKYATNQNNQPYAWNYGRPLENYRDRFSEAVTAALQEQFEVMSVTFNGEAMASVPTDAPGWRRTPYAWLLLKARGPQVDRIPTIQLDFDFLDTSGYTVLPVGSSTVAIDASAAPAPRPWSDLEVTQLLDERRVDEGKLTIEIKAKAKGLVPQLEDILTLDMPGFVVDKRDDQGASVVKFAEDQDTIESERVWLLALKPEGGGASPGNFHFGVPRDEAVTAVFQRYNDADIETVAQDVALGRHIVARNPWWAWVLLGAATVGYFSWFFLQKPSRGPTGGDADDLRMPQQVTPFTVLALLQKVRHRAGVAAMQQQLQADIARIEACHFGRKADPALDLGKVAQDWLRRAV